MKQAVYVLSTDCRQRVDGQGFMLDVKMELTAFLLFVMCVLC